MILVSRALTYDLVLKNNTILSVYLQPSENGHMAVSGYSTVGSDYICNILRFFLLEK